MIYLFIQGGVLKMIKIVNALCDLSDEIKVFLIQHNKLLVSLCILPLVLLSLFQYLPQGKYMPFIIVIPWIITVVPAFLLIIAKLLELITIVCVWMCHNIFKIFATIKTVIIIFSAFFIISFISIGIAIAITNAIIEKIPPYDFMFNGELQTYIVADIISIIIMFLSSLLFHRIYGAYYYDEWSYKLVDIIMTFLVTILFGFLIGISSIFSDYIELYLKNQALTNNVDQITLDTTVYLVISQIKIIVFTIFTYIASFQAAFKITNQYRDKNI